MIQFVLILLFLILGQQQQERVISRTPQNVAPTPASIGAYELVSGTDGCPKEIEWRSECGGFSLTPQDLDAEEFCNINGGTKTTHEPVDTGRKKVLSKVTRKDNLIQKVDTTIYSAANESVRLQEEDTVIIDETGKFLWEHSQDRKGFSCLYSKN